MRLRFVSNPSLAHGAFAEVLEAVHRACSRRRFDVEAAVPKELPTVDFSRATARRQQPLNRAVSAHHEALFGLALLAEDNDAEPGIHIARIGFLAEATALRLGQSRGWAASLRKAAPLHDIGKIGIPDAVVNKPGGFTFDERQLMNRHPVIGAGILRKSRTPLMELAAEVALSHHERFDGLGYPDRLRGEAIPLSGRIVSLVDYFDALAMDRGDRPAMAYPSIQEMLRAERGHAFDPAVVDCFLGDWEGFVGLRERVTRWQPSFGDLLTGIVPAPEFQLFRR